MRVQCSDRKTDLKPRTYTKRQLFGPNLRSRTHGLVSDTTACLDETVKDDPLELVHRIGETFDPCHY